MDISIIVPVYNTESYVSSCIESILSQTFSNYELIIIDDGSNDKSREICDEFAEKDDRIKVYRQRNSGPSVTRNVGLKLAKGKYVAFIDSDDWIQPHYLEMLYQKTEEESLDVVVCGYYDYYSSENCEEILPSTYFDITNLNSKTLEQYNQLLLSEAPLLQGSPCLKLYNRKMLLRNNIFFPEDISRTVDLVFNLRLLPYLRKVGFVDQALYHYRYVDNSVYRKYRNNYLEIARKVNNERRVAIEKIMINKPIDQLQSLHEKADIALLKECINILASETRPDSEKQISAKYSIISDTVKIIKRIPSYKKKYLSVSFQGISPRIIGPVSVVSPSIIILCTVILLKTTRTFLSR